jgi:hypothetical protein
VSSLRLVVPFICAAGVDVIGPLERTTCATPAR